MAILLGFDDATFITNLDGTVSLAAGIPITSSEVASSGSLALALHDDADAFYAPALASQTTLAASLVADADLFHVPALSYTVLVSTVLFDAADTFSVPSIGIEGAEQTVSPAFFDDADTVDAPTIDLAPAVDQTLSADFLNDVDAFPAPAIGDEVPHVIGQEGAGIERPRRPFPVEGEAYGILPQLTGEAHGVVEAVGNGAGTLPDFAAAVAASVGVAGRTEAQLFVRAAGVGDRGQVGAAAAVLNLALTSSGVVGARGSGVVTLALNGAAIGQHDDDEAAVMTFLLAA